MEILTLSERREDSPLPLVEKIMWEKGEEAR